MGKSGYGSIVSERTIRFDRDTWEWAKDQNNLSQSIRSLIKTQLDVVPRGRPVTQTRYRNKIVVNAGDYARGGEK